LKKLEENLNFGNKKIITNTNSDKQPIDIKLTGTCSCRQRGWKIFFYILNYTTKCCFISHISNTSSGEELSWPDPSKKGI
jgi:hypothetical protein